ncbi:MAG: Allergen V5/Tpx related protein [Candidatus Sulfotelmatobacter sp.]|nr:Allergen V5/Tpx related protein [Candidatus Sulfotelmatobacter sp.]
MALLLVMGAASVRPSSRLMASSDGKRSAGEGSGQRATLKPVVIASPNIPLSDCDPQAEQVLLDLANQARAKAGLHSLVPDAGLSRAARAHAQAMVAKRQLSHQFDGELPLPQRLADTSETLLDQEGENVALDFDAESGHKHLMLSPPHRANLLKASYNVIGLGVIRSGDRLYIVQDFGHALPNYSAAEVKERIAATVAQTRHHARQPQLARRDLPTTDNAACSMAQADKLGTSPIHQLAQRYTVLTYTSFHPETLPVTAERTLTSRTLRGFSVGTCYAHTQTYPTGAYWVVLALE